jgi:chitodextrinase
MLVAIAVVATEAAAAPSPSSVARARAERALRDAVGARTCLDRPVLRRVRSKDDAQRVRWRRAFRRRPRTTRLLRRCAAEALASTTTAPAAVTAPRLTARDSSKGSGTSHASFSAAADTYASQVNQDTAHGSYSYLRVLGGSGSNHRNAYLRFDVSGLSGSVSQATLKLFPTSSSSAGIDVHAEADNSWQESTLTWNNAPAFASASSASSGSLSANSPVSIDVSALVDANGSVSFVLTSSDSSGIYLASRESANPPQLEVTTSGGGGVTTSGGGGDSEPPSTPSNLSLGAASTNSLTLAWSAASDNVGVAGYNLYLNGSKLGTTSGTSYSFSGLACGTSYTLAVDAYDGAGNRSSKASLGAATAACPATATGTVPGTGFMAFGGTLSAYANLSKAAYVVFGGDFSVAQPLPGKTLTYMDGTTLANTSWSAGVSYTAASVDGWLLKDASGNYVHPYHDGSRYLGDVGDVGYRQKFISNVQALLAAHPGIDGIEIDNVLPDVAYFSTCSCWPAKYPNASAWQNALVGFVQTVGQALRASGYYVMINATGYIRSSDYDSGLFDQNWWARLAQTGGVSGIFYENAFQDGNNLTRLMDDSSPGSYMHSWAGWEKLISVAQNNGVDFFGITSGPSPLLDPATARHLMRYGRGTFLLDWDGGGGMFGYAVTPAYTSGVDAWDPGWTTNLGTPTGAKYQVGTDVWRRDYTNGSVIVNPTLSSFTTTIAGTSRTIPATDALIVTK